MAETVQCAMLAMFRGAYLLSASQSSERVILGLFDFSCDDLPGFAAGPSNQHYRLHSRIRGDLPRRCFALRRPKSPERGLSIDCFEHLESHGSCDLNLGALEAGHQKILLDCVGSKLLCISKAHASLLSIRAASASLLTRMQSGVFGVVVWPAARDSVTFFSAPLTPDAAVLHPRFGEVSHAM